MKKEVDSFVVGGTHVGPSMPGPILQRMLGREIEIDMEHMCVRVPTPAGRIIAYRGDRVVLYEDGTLEVEH